MATQAQGYATAGGAANDMLGSYNAMGERGAPC